MHDQYVPREELAHQLMRLRELGYTFGTGELEFHEYAGVGHPVDVQQLVDMLNFLGRVIPPVGGPRLKWDESERKMVSVGGTLETSAGPKTASVQKEQKVEKEGVNEQKLEAKDQPGKTKDKKKRSAKKFVSKALNWLNVVD